jgi:16S rRNA (adenine1518-N6/adenine1519-N6)-dimethyltransferase
LFPSIESPSINYDSPGELRAFLEARGLGMRKKFGQNFLVNPAARRELLDALEINAGDEVWEIGPGLGAMTGGLLERGGKVTAFEIDPGFCAVLREFFGEPENFRLIEGDALKTWTLAGKGEERGDGEEGLYLFGNLPYHAGAALLGDFIEKGRFFRRVVVTVQKEVADRMTAKPGSSNYSSFSVLCSSVYALKPLKVIKGASFYPVPRVDSRGVRLDLLPPGERKRPPLFYPLVRALFSSRRKTIKNSLSAFLRSGIMKGREMGEALEILERAGLAGERRPETLSPEEFTRLAGTLEVSCVLYE